MPKLRTVQPIDVETLARMLDMTVRNANVLADQGVIMRIARGKYDMVASVRAYVRYLRGRGSNSMSVSRAKLTGSKAAIEELKFAKMQGEMIPRDQVVSIWTEPAMTMRAHMLSIPSKVAARIGMCKTTVEVQALLRREIEDALSELSKVTISVAGVTGDNASGTGENSDDDIPGDGAAAEPFN